MDVPRHGARFGSAPVAGLDGHLPVGPSAGGLRDVRHPVPHSSPAAEHNPFEVGIPPPPPTSRVTWGILALGLRVLQVSDTIVGLRTG